MPVLNQNARVAILLVGLPRPQSIPLLVIWFFHGTLALLVAAIGGYWLAGKALRPVKMITRMANEMSATDLRDIALASVERLLPLARQSQVTLATGDLPEVLVRGDPQYLGQMLTNLIENGIKYSSGIGKRVYVALACEQERWGVVHVQDDGPGISEEQLPYVFERFYRVDKARSHRQKGPVQSSKPGNEEPAGTGLGLSIVQWIVQAHDGQIRVKSQIGAGSLFEVRLPLLNTAEE